MDKKNFVIIALDTNNKIFVVYIVIWEQEVILVYFKKQIQIKAQNGVLLFDKAFIMILVEYFNYNDIFLIENTAEFLENTGINKHIIKLEKSKQLFFRLIYNLGPIKLEILKTYIKINLANSFI